MPIEQFLSYIMERRSW